VSLARRAVLAPAQNPSDPTALYAAPLHSSGPSWLTVDHPGCVLHGRFTSAEQFHAFGTNVIASEPTYVSPDAPLLRQPAARHKSLHVYQHTQSHRQQSRRTRNSPHCVLHQPRRDDNCGERETERKTETAPACGLLSAHSVQRQATKLGGRPAAPLACIAESGAESAATGTALRRTTQAGPWRSRCVSAALCPAVV
jgi:hypothetical protein